MEYFKKSANTQRKPSDSGAARANNVVYRTGLFVPSDAARAKGVSSLCSVAIKEEITLKPGQFITIFHNTDKKSDNSPDYTLRVTEGK